MNRIAVLTSGGDAPGMNAAVRAVVRTGIYQNFEIFGVIGGYHGLIENQIRAMDLRSVANIIQSGGTILKTGRSREFETTAGRAQAWQNLKSQSIEGLIVIGGDGSFRGAEALRLEHGLRVMGIPATIDNDIFGTDDTLGFDTAVNTAVEAMDRIRDTAFSHDRVFIVEVMGRNSGFLAAAVGIAGGAEEIFVPENPFSMEKTSQRLNASMQKGKKSSILVAAEGQKPGRAYDLAESLRKKLNLNAKVCVLGHLQRGGRPSAHDRNLASRMGAAAVNSLIEQRSGHYIAVQQGGLTLQPLSLASQSKSLDQDLIQLVGILSQ